MAINEMIFAILAMLQISDAHQHNEISISMTQIEQVYDYTTGNTTQKEDTVELVGKAEGDLWRVGRETKTGSISGALKFNINTANGGEMVAPNGKTLPINYDTHFKREKPWDSVAKIELKQFDGWFEVNHHEHGFTLTHMKSANEEAMRIVVSWRKQ